MRPTLTILTVGFLAACSGANGDEIDSTRQMLEADDPKVCADTDVQNTALALVNNEYMTYLEDGGQRLRFEAVSATGIDKDIHQVSCSANVRMQAPHVRFDAIRQIAYLVRPALDDEDGYILEVERDNELGFTLSSVISQYEEMQSERRHQEDEQSEGAQNDAAFFGEDDSIDFGNTPKKASSYDEYSRQMIEGNTVVPSQFQGEWNEDLSACGNGTNDSRLRIYADRLQFYESTGYVKRARIVNPQSVELSLSFSGEGSTWEDSLTLVLKKSGQSLNVDGSLRNRCP